jgi:hypothetical protein
MLRINRQVRIPKDAQWVQLTDELLASREEQARWIKLAEGFEPYHKDPGPHMAERLLTAIKNGRLERETHIIYNHLVLGFFQFRQAGAVVKDPQSPPRITTNTHGMLLRNIVRSERTKKGFGQALLNQAIMVSRRDPENNAIFLEPANPKVGEHWEGRYNFRPVDDPKNEETLYLPLHADDEDDEA